jgi:hypothetical protein
MSSEATSRVPERVGIAFSFLARDEAIVQRFAAALRPDFGTFVYSEHQREIAGRDGVELFTQLYSESAQFVVVMYRDGYGTTPWTRVEEDAIKARGLKLGWDSLLLVAVLAGPTVNGTSVPLTAIGSCSKMLFPRTRPNITACIGTISEASVFGSYRLDD